MVSPNFKIKSEVDKEDYGKFVIEPLQEGYGQTLGNSLRRVLLTSIPGAAVTTVKINGVSHQFTTLSGLKEDIVEIILNVKKLRLKLHSEKSATLRISVNGPKEITAADFEETPDIEIINKDLYIGTLADKKAKLDMELTVDHGMGYSLGEERKVNTVGIIPIDAAFSPVVRVNYKVEATRVGQMTNLDKLIIEIWTDGTISPMEVMKDAATHSRLHVLCRYALDLAQAFNEFYHCCQIISEEKTLMRARLAVVDATRQVLANSLGVLGIDALEEM